MSEGIGFFSALWRFFTFYKLRKALGLARAADAQFTGSVDGISDAFDLHQDALIRQFNGLRDAVAQVENVLEDKRHQLDTLNQKEDKLIKLREGALAKAESDPANTEQHKAAFNRYQTEISETEQRQAVLEKEIGEVSQSMKKHMLQLTDLQSKIQRLPEGKANAIADHVSAKMIIQLNDRLNGLQTSLDRGPIDAVLKANRELTAKARITEKLAGTDVRLQDQEYEQAGSQSLSDTSFDKMLAARKAEREAKTGVKAAPATVTESSGDGRPRI